MKKVTLAFPDPGSLWLFKDQSKAINIAITPGKNIIAGLFPTDEIARATTEFKAAEISTISTTSNRYSAKTRRPKPLFTVARIMSSFRSGLYQLRSIMNF